VQYTKADGASFGGHPVCSIESGTYRHNLQGTVHVAARPDVLLTRRTSMSSPIRVVLDDNQFVYTNDQFRPPLDSGVPNQINRNVTAFSRRTSASARHPTPPPPPPPSPTPRFLRTEQKTFGRVHAGRAPFDTNRGGDLLPRRTVGPCALPATAVD